MPAVSLPHFPYSLMREDSVQFDLQSATIGGGVTMGGLMPIARLDGGGLWKATMRDIFLRTPDHIRAWRALSAICDGGFQPIIVPMCDKRFFPAPVVGGSRLVAISAPHDNDAPFDNDSEYAGSVVEINVVDAADLRATSLTVDLVAGSDLMGGEYFSIDHEDLRWRLYKIRTAVANGDGTWAITIRSPLRAAIDAGTPLEFDRPRCVMRLSTPGAMDLVLEQRKRARPSVSFIEDFPPFPE